MTDTPITCMGCNMLLAHVDADCLCDKKVSQQNALRYVNEAGEASGAGLLDQPSADATPRFPPDIMLTGARYASQAAFRGIPFFDLTLAELQAVAGHLMHDAAVFRAELRRREGAPRLILPGEG